MRSRPRKPAWPSFVWKTCGVDAERLERAHAADAEEDLLAEPVLDVAAVEPVGDLRSVGRVLVDVGVEQVQRHAADLGPPHLRRRSGCAGEVDRRPARRRTGVSAIAYGSRSG